MTMAEDIQAANSRTSFRIMRYAMFIGATILGTLLMMVLSNLSGGYAVGSGNGVAAVQDRMTWPIIIHLATAIPAIPLGAYVLWAKKGDATHKLLGKIWAVLMLTTAIISLFIGRPGAGIAGTGYSFIHIFSIVVLVSIPVAIWRIRNGDVEGHRRAMQGPYIGLIIAGLFTFIPGRILGTLAFG